MIVNIICFVEFPRTVTYVQGLLFMLLFAKLLIDFSQTGFEVVCNVNVNLAISKLISGACNYITFQAHLRIIVISSSKLIRTNRTFADPTI
jgi:hypothetical protein